MKRIVILDTWVNDTNQGNKIIMEAVGGVLRSMFPHDIIYHVPALEYIDAGQDLVKTADYIFLGGTNVLSSNMNRTSEWRLRLRDVLWLGNVVLLGVGWWQYQKKRPNLYTRVLLNQILSTGLYHSVRDSYTANKLRSMGFSVLNTGCPTIWCLTESECAKIPQTKGRDVILTFTEYNKNANSDKLLYQILKRNYRRVYFWPQQFGDYNYAKMICGNELAFIDPSLEALDNFLENEDIDYCGTRLHAGIRALQHNRRAMIIGVDNRGIEMKEDFNLPVISRALIATNLEQMITSNWSTKIDLDTQAIASWKEQFTKTLLL